MGFMYYGNQSHEIELEDRPLTHLKIALLTLLRAGHSVAFSMERPVSTGSGRETLWITPHTDLRFRFNGGRPVRVNEDWVKLLIASAGSPAGMRLCREPAKSQAVPA